MAIKGNTFDATLFYYKVLLLCFLVVVDIFFNSFTQFINFGVKVVDTSCHKDDLYLCIGLSMLQFIFIIIMIFVLLNIFSETYFFKKGLLGIICAKFIFSFIFLFLYPIFFLIERIFFGMNVNDYKREGENAPIIKIWNSGYLVLYIIKYITAFGFYIGMLRTTFELGKAEYYRTPTIKT